MTRTKLSLFFALLNRKTVPKKKNINNEIIKNCRVKNSIFFKFL